MGILPLFLPHDPFGSVGPVRNRGSLPSDGSPIGPQQNLKILQHLAIAGDCHRFNLSWTRKCTQSLTLQSKFLPQNLKRVSQFFIGRYPPFRSQIVIVPYILYPGIDLSRPNVGLKAYFFPSVGSKTTGTPAMDMLTSTISNLGMAFPWSKATMFFSTLPQEYKIEPVIAAVDCVSASENRFKVYVRTQATHPSALCDMINHFGGSVGGSRYRRYSRQAPRRPQVYAQFATVFGLNVPIAVRPKLGLYLPFATCLNDKVATTFVLTCTARRGLR